MIYNHRYVSLKVLKLLIKEKCSICQPIAGNIRPHWPVYYTKAPNHMDFPDCDAYYYPTQDQVIDWLEQEHKIFISSFPLFKLETLYSCCKRLQGGYGVDIKDEKGIEYGCQKNYKTKEEAINAALLKVLNELI